MKGGWSNKWNSNGKNSFLIKRERGRGGRRGREGKENKGEED